MMLHRSVSVCTILRTVRRSVRTRIRTSLFSFSSYSNYWHPARINLLRWCSNSSSSLPLKIATDSIPVYVYTHDCEPQSRKQLIRLAESGLAVGYVAAMPDVHLGKGATVGSVFASRDYVIPNAVGVDIGCGMAAVPMLNLKRSHLYKNSKGNDSTLRHIQRLLKERIPTGFNAHASPLRTAHSEIMRISKESPPSPWLELQLQSKGNIKRRGNAGIRALRQLGTLGGGNHFIEVLYDESDNVWLMLHCKIFSLSLFLSSLSFLSLTLSLTLSLYRCVSLLISPSNCVSILFVWVKAVEVMFLCLKPVAGT